MIQRTNRVFYTEGETYHIDRETKVLVTIV